MPKRSSNSSALYSILLCATLLLSCVLAVVAQSGRRVRKSAPAPVPTPEATPTPRPQSQKATPAFAFVVGMDRYGDFSSISLYTYDGVLRSCADRLDESLSVKAQVSSSDMSRSDAIRKAKAEKEAYIVWLQLRPNFTGQTGSNNDSNNVYVEYSVFEPTTAKLATSGNTYPEAYRNKRIRLPTPTSSGDYYVNQAARGAAERILDHFHLRVPNRLP
jgi:hypothetical protein